MNQDDEFPRLWALPILVLLVCAIAYGDWRRLADEDETANHITPEAAKARVCPLHGTALQFDRVEVYGGLYTHGPNDKDFPYANRWAGGGCTYLGPGHALVLFCRDCRKVEDAWRRKYYPYLFTSDGR